MTTCVDCGEKLGSFYRNIDGGLCDPCYWKRLDKRKRAVRTWMYLHREEIGLSSVPIEVIEYCSQAFDNWSGEFGYHIPSDPTETKKIPIGPALLNYGTTCGIIGNKFDINAVKFLVAHSAEEYIVAEVLTNPLIGEIQNMAVRWKDDEEKEVLDDEGYPIRQRDQWSYEFQNLVYGFGGSLRPDCVDYDRWDTFESE